MAHQGEVLEVMLGRGLSSWGLKLSGVRTEGREGSSCKAQRWDGMGDAPGTGRLHHCCRQRWCVLSPSECTVDRGSLPFRVISHRSLQAPLETGTGTGSTEALTANPSHCFSLPLRAASTRILGGHVSLE